MPEPYLFYPRTPALSILGGAACLKQCEANATVRELCCWFSAKSGCYMKQGASLTRKYDDPLLQGDGKCDVVAMTKYAQAVSGRSFVRPCLHGPWDPAT